MVVKINNNNNNNKFIHISKFYRIRDQSEITVGGGGGRATIYVGRVIIFSNKILGGSLYFLPKLREGHNFFYRKAS